MMKSKKLKRTKLRQKLVKPSVLAMDGFPDSKLALDWSVKKVDCGKYSVTNLDTTQNI